MLKNYFKIAIAVLKRRKFFTFISLFGISFTLTILTVASAFMDKILSPEYPDYKRDRSLYVGTMEYKNTKEGWLSRSDVSYYFFSKYVSTLKNVEKMAISSYAQPSNAYINNKKIVVNYKYTNADYWNVLEYVFLEGKPFGQREINNAEKVAVISEATRKNYFGDEKNVVGKFISADNIEYRVIGVVSNVSETLYNLSGDMYLPYTLAKIDNTSTDLMGTFNAVLLAKSKDDVPKMKKEFDQMVSKVPVPSEFDKLYCNADYYFTAMTRRTIGDGADDGLAKIILIVSVVTLLFLLLPTLNLVNINITRILERSSEIGVRKAFGASSKTLVYQFIVENLILTFLGGLIGIVLSMIIIYLINDANLISNTRLTINYSVLFYSLIACIFFGLFSGVYPAYRMSKLNIVKALKAQ